jgi:serine/threonine kinase 16
MAVLSAQYKHPQSAYSQGLRNLIDSMLKTNPKERPDINQVRLHYIIIALATLY